VLQRERQFRTPACRHPPPTLPCPARGRAYHPATSPHAQAHVRDDHAGCRG
jgi:hypothetical protein